ncbi:MAG TPA: hypothetical protein QGH16_00140, partial [Verrucomicrobiota bacterium]|nr:hypothetical protein [Verrucomicrobiota bacterium]
MKKNVYIPTAATGLLVTLIVLTAGCGQAPSGETTGNTAQLEALKKENGSLKVKLANAQSRIDSFRAQLNSGESTVVDSSLSVPEIIEELTQIKMTSKDRRAVQRRINFLFESLVEQGEASVPHISEFLNKMEDIDFVVQRSEEEENERGRGGNSRERGR